jgi:hypothetical protein
MVSVCEPAVTWRAACSGPSAVGPKRSQMVHWSFIAASVEWPQPSLLIRKSLRPEPVTRTVSTVADGRSAVTVTACGGPRVPMG